MLPPFSPETPIWRPRMASRSRAWLASHLFMKFAGSFLRLERHVSQSAPQTISCNTHENASKKSRFSLLVLIVYASVATCCEMNRVRLVKASSPVTLTSSSAAMMSFIG